LQKKKIWDVWQIARLTWTEEDKYGISYFPHTGKYEDLPLEGTLDECLEMIRNNEMGLFWMD
jgi:hypothetical protein